jgi:ABC-type nitrate/sulfonate/bicarbonate transport system permease component
MRQLVINLVFDIALVIAAVIFLAVTGYVLDSMFDDARRRWS